ncbi:MAG: flavodoxin domain-containing protein, partial [Dehalococcoidales bacterium]
MNKRINIIYISLTGITEAMVEAAAEGAREAGAEVRLIKANESKGVDDLLECDAVIFGTGNYFGYMEGLLKHWYDLYQIPVKKMCKKKDLPWKPYFSCSSGGWNVDKPMVIMEYMNWGMRLKKAFPYETCMGKVTPE